MIKTFFLFLFLLISLNPLIAQNLYKDMWATFQGTLGTHQIELTIYTNDNDQIQGNYFYSKHEKRIMLFGKASGNDIDLIELYNGAINGYFKLNKISLDSLNGLWTNKSKSVILLIKLKLFTLFKFPYQYIYGLPTEVEPFMTELKENILEKNKNWIADHICYPINVRLLGKQKIQIENKKQFIKNFEQIFYKKFVFKIKNSSIFDLYYNTDGVMLGDEYIYISNTPNSTESNYNFCISQINNE